MSIPTTEQLVAIADEAGERAYAQKQSLTRIAEIRVAAVRDAVFHGLIAEAGEIRLEVEQSGDKVFWKIVETWLKIAKAGAR